MYDLDCTMTAMQAVDIPTNNRYQAILAELLIVRAGDDRETQAAAQEPGTCSAIASSVEADDPKGMSREQIAHNAHVLYRCAMDAFTREPDTWFIATSTARRRLLDELVSRERVLGATAPSK